MIKINLTEDVVTTHFEFVSTYFNARKDKPTWIEKVTQDVMDYIDNNLHDIICGTPDILLNLNRVLNRDYILDILTRDNKTIKQHLKNLLSYENFRDGKHGFERWNAYELADAIKVNVCPYCNRQYTNTVILNNINGNRDYIIKPAFDHFYCRAEYPVLGLSIYNLIPSCTTCNSTLKLEEDFALREYMHPYVEGFDNDGVFTYTPQIAEGLFNPEIDNVEIRIDCTTAPEAKRERIENNTTFFAINTIYTQCHVDLLNEILQKCRDNPPEHLRFLARLTNMNTTEGLYRYLFSNYLNQDDYLKRPLSKFTKDIATELGIIDRLNQFLPLN